MMKKLQVFPLLCLSVVSFGQIPNLPTISQPQASGLGNYSNQSFGNSMNGRNSQRNYAPSMPSAYQSPSNSVQQHNTYESQSRSRNDALMREIDRDIAEAQQTQFRNWVENGRRMSYDLPSLSGKAGTKFYYDAFNKLSAMDSENYSLADANFTVENAFYDNKQDLAKFKSGIQKTAKQLLQKMQERKQDTESNVSKNLMLFEYFSKDMKLGGTTHKAFEYDFEDVFGHTELSNLFVSKLLDTQKGNCNSMPYLYKILAEELGVDANLALAPNHVYIKHNIKSIGWYNTELTSGIFPIDAWLSASGFIHLDAMKNGVFMKALNNKESLALLLVDLANAYNRSYPNNDGSFSLKCAERAIQIYPYLPNALLLQAETHTKQFQKNDERTEYKRYSGYVKQSES